MVPKKGELRKVPTSKLFTAVGAVKDENNVLSIDAYAHFKDHFREEPPRERHPDPENPGVRPEEMADLRNVHHWSDDRGAGWIAEGRDGKKKKSKWFSTARWGSWRLPFLLARIQAELWSESESAGAAAGAGIKKEPSKKEAAAKSLHEEAQKSSSYPSFRSAGGRRTKGETGKATKALDSAAVSPAPKSRISTKRADPDVDQPSAKPRGRPKSASGLASEREETPASEKQGSTPKGRSCAPSGDESKNRIGHSRRANNVAKGLGNRIADSNKRGPGRRKNQTQGTESVGVRLRPAASDKKPDEADAQWLAEAEEFLTDATKKTTTGKAVEKGNEAEVVDDDEEQEESEEEEKEVEEHGVAGEPAAPEQPVQKGNALKTPARSKVAAEGSRNSKKQASYSSNNQAKVVVPTGIREQISSEVDTAVAEKATVKCACGAVIQEAGKSTCNRCCRNQKIVENAKQAEADTRGSLEVFPISSRVCVNGHALSDTQAFCTGTCDRCNSYIKGGDKIFQCARCQPIYWICDSCKVHFKETSVERGVKRVYSLDDVQQGFGARSKKTRRSGNADHESSDADQHAMRSQD